MAWGSEATLGSGLPDRFLLTIRTARIKTPEGWSNDVVVFEGEQNVDGDISDGDLRLSVGQFEPGDAEGTFLVAATQRPEIFDTHYERIKKINKNSAYGRLLNSAFEVMVPLEQNQKPERAKYEIWDLLMWEGLTVDVEMRERSFVYKEDVGAHKAGESGSTRDAFVVGFVEGGAGAATPATTSTPAASNNGSVDPKKFDSHLSYLEAYVAAGGDTGDEAASKTYYEAARS